MVSREAGEVTRASRGGRGVGERKQSDMEGRGTLLDDHAFARNGGYALQLLGSTLHYAGSNCTAKHIRGCTKWGRDACLGVQYNTIQY